MRRGEFAITNNTCGSSVLSNSLCEIDITLTPSASGTRSAALNLDDNEACSPQQTTLTGGSSAGPFTVTVIDVLTYFNGGYESRGGTITSTPAGINCGSSANTCSASFPAGTNVSLTETPDTGASFLGWGNACSGSASCSITLNTDAQVSANFAEPLQVTLAGTGTGTVTSSPAGISCKNGGGTCSASFPFGTSVTLATPGADYAAGSNADAPGAPTMFGQLYRLMIALRDSNLGFKTSNIQLSANYLFNGSNSAANWMAVLGYVERYHMMLGGTDSWIPAWTYPDLPFDGPQQSGPGAATQPET